MATATLRQPTTGATSGCPVNAEAYTYWELEKIGTSSTTNIAGAWA